MPDRFADDAAAYLLGALPAAERDAFEQHLPGCPECAAAVAELAPAVRALAAVPHEDLLDPAREPTTGGPTTGGPTTGGPTTGGPTAGDGAVPDTLLPRMLRDARAARRRRTVLTGATAAAAACAAAVLATLALDRGPATAPAGQPMQALFATPVHATAALQSQPWGTQITVNCRYDPGSSPARPYTMVVLDRSGQPHELGSWRIDPGQDITFTGGTDLAAGQISAVEVSIPDGPAILRLTT